MVFETPQLAIGSRFEVMAAEYRGRYPALDFLQDLVVEDQIKMERLFNLLAEQGMIANRQKFKKIEGKLFEFKSHQIRMPCFFLDRQVIVTHGLKKKQDKLPKTEIERAEEIRKYVLEHHPNPTRHH